MLLERLETRLPFAAPTDLSSIQGRIYRDLNGNGFNPGEEVAGATVNLYRDNGDGTFNAGSDTLVTSVTSASDGKYAFQRVAAGSYFVQQPQQQAGGKPLSQSVSPLIRITADEGAGELFTVIDSFNASPQLVFDDTNDGVPAKSSVPGPVAEIIGGERDVLVNKTSVNGRVQISVNDPLLPGFLSFDSLQTGQGRRLVSWDGADGDAAVIQDNGLNAVDLTNGGKATGLRLAVGADSPNGTATIRIYTNDNVAGTANRFSTGVLAIPDTGGEASSLEYIPFSAFTASGGGAADFSRVGAIEMEITGAANVNGATNLVGAIGPTVKTYDFSNFQSADLSLSIAPANQSVGLNSNATFTLTVRNSGPDGATGVEVTVPIPTGLTFQNSTPSTGSYNASTGIWTVGAIPNGGTATLALVTQVVAIGPTTLTAEISKSDQFDPDSTPGNGVSTEDDQASATVSAQAADLSLTMTASNLKPGINQEIFLTLTINNAGPSTATGVRVGLPLPAGVSFVSAAPGQGSFSNNVWTVGSLAAGASSNLTVRVKMNAFGPQQFVAEVIASDQPDPNSTPGNNNPNENDQASVSVTVEAADLSLAMAVDNNKPGLNADTTFTITVRNAGPNDATGVTVLARLPVGLQYVSATQDPGGNAASYDASTGIWTIGTIANGNQVSLRLTAKPTVGGTLTMVAQVQTSDQPDPNSTPGNNNTSEDDYASLSITPQLADLSLTLTANNQLPNLREQVTLTTTLSNAGPSTATGVQVKIPVPSGLRLQSNSFTGGTYNASTGIWTVPTLAAGASVRLTLVTSIETVSPVTVTAEVIASDQPDPDSTPGNNVPTEDDQASVTIRVRSADLSLSNSASNLEPNVDEVVTFTIVVNNAGPDTATGVVVGALLPTGLTFTAANPSQGTYQQGTGRWTVGSINAGSSATLLLSARVDSRGPKSLTAQVLQSDQADPNSTPGNGIEGEDDQETVTVTPPVIDLSLTMTADPTKALINKPIKFSLRLANAGPSNATNISVKVPLPPGLTYDSQVPSVGSYNPGSSLWSLPALAKGANATLDLIAIYDAPNSITVTAEVFAVDQFDSNSTPNNNVPTENDQASVKIEPSKADLVLTQKVSNATPNLGASTTITITVKNLGPDTATGVTVKNLLPAELSLVSSTASKGAYSPVTGIWNIGSITRNQTVTLDLVVTPTGTGEIVNIAEVQTMDQFDPNSTPGNGVDGENDQASIAITPQLIDLSLGLTISNQKPNVGQNVTYQLVVNNAGPSTATGVSVLSRLPANVTFISATSTSGNFVPGTGIWTPLPIAPGAAARLTVIARVNQPGVGLATAEVMTADQPDVDSTPGNGDINEDDYAQIGFATPVADLSLSISVDNETPNRNEIVEFTVTINNSGPDDATNVVVKNQLPNNFNFASSAATLGIYTPSAGQWVLPKLLAGESAVLTYSGKITNLKPVVSTAEVIRSDQSDPDSTPANGNPDEDDIATVTVTPNVIDLSVTGKIDNPKPVVDDIVNLTYTVTNSGPSDATGVELKLNIPTGVKFLLFTQSAGFYNQATGKWNVGTLNAGETATLTIQLCILLPGIKLATLEVTAADQFDIDSTPNNGIMTEDDIVSVVINAPRVLTKRLMLSR